MTLADGLRIVSLRTNGLAHYTSDGRRTLCAKPGTRSAFLRPEVPGARVCKRCENLEADIWLWSLPVAPPIPTQPGQVVAVFIPK
jgi:hypothetical protein